MLFLFFKWFMREMRGKKNMFCLVNLSSPPVHLPYKHLPSLDRDRSLPLPLALTK